MNRLYLLGLMLVLLVACNNQPEKKEGDTKDSTPVKQAEMVSPADVAIAKNEAINRLDALEKLFNNENFLLVNGKDSSYFYFSRLGKSNMFVHSYKMIKGDSADLKIDTVQMNANNKLQFNWQGKQLVLTSATDYVSSWIMNKNANDKIDFQRIDKRTLNVVEGEKRLVLHKTLNLSLFLVRSFYDYEHGTRYAWDSVDTFKPRPVKPIK